MARSIEFVRCVRAHTFMTPTRNGLGRGLEICHLFLDSIVFLKIDLLFIFENGGGRGLKISHFLETS